MPERQVATAPLVALGLFAYGSLVAPASAAMTLGREVELAARARLVGWSRRWTTCRDNLGSEKTFSLLDGSMPAYCLGLNVEPVAGEAGANGALIALGSAELERLDRRELRYERADVTAAVDPLPAGISRAFAYVARRERHAPVPPAGAVIIAAYVRAVEEAFAALGPGELELYRATTEPPPAPVVEARLVRDQIPPGNPRLW